MLYKLLGEQKTCKSVGHDVKHIDKVYNLYNVDKINKKNYRM